MRTFIRYDWRPGTHGREYYYQVAYGMFSLSFCYIASPLEPRWVTAAALRVRRSKLRRVAREQLKEQGLH